MSQIHTLSLSNGLTPSVEIFCIDVPRPSQKEDAGWYYQMSIEGQHIGEPQGPYPSDNDALQAVQNLFAY